MGCNCKQLKRVEKKYPSILIPTYNKSGVKKFINIIKTKLWNLLGHLFIIFSMILLIPLIILVVLFNYIRYGELVFSLPFFKNKN